MEKTGKIYGINGPVITVKGDVGFSMGEMVYAGEEKLIGEVISLTEGIYNHSGLRRNLRNEARGNDYGNRSHLIRNTGARYP